VNSRPASPVVISFHAGDSYYHEAADRLRADCDVAGVDHDIVELSVRPNASWLDICRRKIPFYLDMRRKHQRPLLWLDVDSRLGAWPTVLDGATCDIAAFLRDRVYLREFDPLAAPRFFAPFALYLNHTASMGAFLELMARLEAQSDEKASDDFFLQEAWRLHDQQLTVMLLPPALVGYEWPLANRQIFYHGVSGNVPVYRRGAAQHEPGLLAPQRRKRLLMHEGGRLRREGRIDDALVLYRCALEVDQEDTQLSGKIRRLEAGHEKSRR
jgi:hypothetical protein